MKRYEPILDHSIAGVVMPDMRPADDGQWYHRADLITAGCLVPVPDGEAMGVWDAGFGCFFQCEHPGVWRLCGCSNDHMAPCQIKNISDGTVVELTGNAPVQPVRLVRLEDVAREPHDKYAGKAPHDVRGWEPN